MTGGVRSLFLLRSERRPDPLRRESQYLLRALKVRWSWLRSRDLPGVQGMGVEVHTGAGKWKQVLVSRDGCSEGVFGVLGLWTAPSGRQRVGGIPSTASGTKKVARMLLRLASRRSNEIILP